MALSCASKVIKTILFILNVLFWLTGVILLSVGIWILASHSTAVQYLHIANLDYGLVQGAAITVIIVGTIVFVIGVLGCCGAVKENQHCLTAFSGILIVLLILQFVAVILAGVFHSKIIHTLATEMNHTMVTGYDQHGTVHRLETEAWDFLQIEMKCCGVGDNGPSDWQYTQWYQYNATEGAVVPLSCCVQSAGKYNFSHPSAENATACYLAASNHNMPVKERSLYVNVKGCETSLNDWFMDSLGIFIGVTVAIIITQIIIVFLACILKSSIKNSYEHI